MNNLFIRNTNNFIQKRFFNSFLEKPLSQNEEKILLYYKRSVPFSMILGGTAMNYCTYGDPVGTLFGVGFGPLYPAVIPIFGSFIICDFLGKQIRKFD